MKIMSSLICLSLWLPSLAICASVEMSKTYIVHKKFFTDTQLNYMRNYGYSLKQTPELYQTRVIRAKNTDYYIVEVTTKTQVQNDVIVNGIANGSITTIQESYYYKTSEGKIDVHRNNYTYSKDLSRQWSVEKTTP